MGNRCRRASPPLSVCYLTTYLATPDTPSPTQPQGSDSNMHHAAASGDKVAEMELLALESAVAILRSMVEWSSDLAEAEATAMRPQGLAGDGDGDEPYDDDAASVVSSAPSSQVRSVAHFVRGLGGVFFFGGRRYVDRFFPLLFGCSPWVPALPYVYPLSTPTPFHAGRRDGGRVWERGGGHADRL